MGGEKETGNGLPWQETDQEATSEIIVIIFH